MPKKIGDLTLYSVDDLHELLGLSKMTLRAYLRKGKLKGRKLGVQWFITEEAIRAYFQESDLKKPETKKREFTYVIQGVNDLVSEKEEFDNESDTIESLNNQAIISLFQVAVIDKESGETIEIVKARDFLERYR